MLTRLFSAKATVLALVISVTCTLFIACFANSPRSMDESFSGEYWYYINRGHPERFVGWTLEGTEVKFPHVKLPLVVQLNEAKLQKIFDITKTVPLLITFFLLAYLPAYVFQQVVEKNKSDSPVWAVTVGIVLTVGVFIYRFWFSRI